MSKALLYIVCAFFGAVLLVAGAQSNWFMAALMGAGLGITVALVAHTYPRDAAPPADRRHEAAMRRKGVRV